MIPRVRPWVDHKAVAEALDEDGSDARPAFERSFARAHGTEDSVATNTGRGALLVGLRALAMPPQSEILVPAIVCNAVVDAILSAGMIPVPVDVDPHNLNIDPESALKATTKETAAVVAVHTYGVPCEIDALADLCEDHGLYLVEDCAQSLGSTVNQRPVGTHGDVSIFSFGFDKMLSLGSGGMVLSRRAETCARIRALIPLQPVAPEREKAHMIRFLWLHALFNSNVYWATRHLRLRFETLEWPSGEVALPLGPMRSALGSAVLDKAGSIANTHRDHAELMISELEGTAIQLPRPGQTDLPSFLRLTIGVDPRIRDSLSRYMVKNGFEIVPAAYDRPIHSYSYYAQFLRRRVDLSIAEHACRSLLNLPTHTYMSTERAMRLSELMCDYVRNT